MCGQSVKQRLRWLLAAVILGAMLRADAEETRSYVRDIQFNGNETFERGVLLRSMELRPKGLLRKSAFTDLKLRADIGALERWYVDHGFIDVDVRAEVKRDPEKRKWIDLVIGIEEGRRVMVDSVAVTPLAVIGDATPEYLRTKVGDPFVGEVVRADARSLRDSLGASGFIRAAVVPMVVIDSSRYRAQVYFEVRRGPRVIAGPIRTEGIEDVKETVVLRELAFEEGDTLTPALLRRSEIGLYRTGLFRFVSIDPVLPESIAAPIPSDTVVPVVVTADQTDFYALEAGVGYSYVERIRLSLMLSYANLFGRGHRISLESEVSSVEQLAELSYNTPWLFFVPLLTEISGYYRRHDTLFFDVPMGYSGEFAGVSASVGRLTDFGLSYRVGLTYENVLRLSTPEAGEVPEDVEEKNTSSVGVELSFDRRDDVFSPTRGFWAGVSGEFAGLFGRETNQFVKATGDFSVYYGVSDVLFFGSGLELGWAGSYGRSDVVPPQEQFYEGGPRSVRGYGFEELVVGPQGDPVGGNVKLVVHVVDLRFPLFWWFWGAAFLDAGYVWEDLGSVSFGDIKYGAGPSLRLITPIAMIRFDVGFKLNPRKGEDLVVYYLDIGQAF